MEQQLEKLMSEAQQAVNVAADLQSLDQVRVNYLGKKGSITEMMKELGKLPPEQRPEAGQVINRAKQTIQGAIEAKKETLQSAKLQAQLESETIDVTMPGRSRGIGGPEFRKGLRGSGDRCPAVATEISLLGGPDHLARPVVCPKQRSARLPGVDSRIGRDCVPLFG